MNWQLALALILVACSAVYLAIRGWRTWCKSGRGCGSGCAQKPAPTLIPPEQVVLRRR